MRLYAAQALIEMLICKVSCPCGGLRLVRRPNFSSTGGSLHAENSRNTGYVITIPIGMSPRSTHPTTGPCPPACAQSSDLDWGQHLDFVKTCKQKLQKKVDYYNAWIDASDRNNLLQRSRLHTATINKYITQDGIVFSGRFRVIVEGNNSNFSFVLKANPEDGFAIDWEDVVPVDQSIYLPERLWAAILEGKIMWGMYQWTTEIQEHVPYRIDLGRFWYWLEYNLDWEQESQAIMEPRLYPN